jgi:hypothetical protein
MYTKDELKYIIKISRDPNLKGSLEAFLEMQEQFKEPINYDLNEIKEVQYEELSKGFI